MLSYVTDDLFGSHRAEGSHPERPERARAVHEALEDTGVLENGHRIDVRPATREELARVHTPRYLDSLETDVAGKTGYLDADTYFCPATWEAVLAAAGASVDLVGASLCGAAPRGFAAVRPPGHHAEADRAMGFCLLNNVAVAAAAALDAGLSRVAIVDWDVHHGNGTQHMFESDPRVLFASVHQYPFYPGTGASDEIGTGAGRGTTVNVPLCAGSGDDEYAAAFDEVVVPALTRFAPELVLVSGGFDAYDGDPLAQMHVTPRGFARMARQLRSVADETASGRLLGFLEGGYSLDGLRASVSAVLDAWAGEGARPAPLQPGRRLLPAARSAIDATQAALGVVP